jgi:hypothetical protein
LSVWIPFSTPFCSEYNALITCHDLGLEKWRVVGVVKADAADSNHRSNSEVADSFDFIEGIAIEIVIVYYSLLVEESVSQELSINSRKVLLKENIF